MKPLILMLPLLLMPLSASAQTQIQDKNIQACFKQASKNPVAFDWCVAQEFRRVREEKERREARIRVGKDPDAGCGKPSAYKECFEEIMQDRQDALDRLYDGSGSSIRRHRFYFPYRPLYLRRYFPAYRRSYIPRYRTWRRY